jgi:hypothetical protein
MTAYVAELWQLFDDFLETHHYFELYPSRPYSESSLYDRRAGLQSGGLRYLTRA